jgi:hypothetical protein
MADFTLSSGAVPRVFPEGAQVGAYPRGGGDYPVERPRPAFLVPGEPGGQGKVLGEAAGKPRPPVDEPEATSVVAGGVLTFLGLAPRGQYWAAAEVDGRWRYVAFTAGPPPP